MTGLGSLEDKYSARKRFYDQPKEPASVNAVKNPYVDFYRLGRTGQIITEFRLHTGVCKTSVEIDQITDIHLNYCDAQDLRDEELAYTMQCRQWLANGESLESCAKALDAAQYADQIIITGDTLDYLSHGAEMLTKALIFSRFPEALIAVGGHDVTKEMQTGIPNRLDFDERLAYLASFWPHDIYYTSKNVGDSVIAVVLNCGGAKEGYYHECQIDPLSRDIERARREGKILLLFQHEPISTGNPADTEVNELWHTANVDRNFYDAPFLCGRPGQNDPATDAVYKLITENADVVRGLFCGHYHSAFYMEIQASRPGADGERIPAVIPQYLAVANPCGRCGIVTRIIID